MLTPTQALFLKGTVHKYSSLGAHPHLCSTLCVPCEGMLVGEVMSQELHPEHKLNFDADSDEEGDGQESKLETPLRQFERYMHVLI